MEKNRLTKIIRRANNDHSSLPEKQTLIQRLYERIASLENALPQSQNEEEYTLISTEIRRIRETVTLVKDSTSVLSAYKHLEHDANTIQSRIDSYTVNGEVIPHALQIDYDLAVYHYNEYCNAVESLI